MGEDDNDDDDDEGLTGGAAAAAAEADFSSMGRGVLTGGFPKEELSPFLMTLVSLLLLFLFLVDFLVVVDSGGRKASARGARIS